jgi:hypothetical protein
MFSFLSYILFVSMFMICNELKNKYVEKLLEWPVCIYIYTSEKQDGGKFNYLGFTIFFLIDTLRQVLRFNSEDLLCVSAYTLSKFWEKGHENTIFHGY